MRIFEMLYNKIKKKAVISTRRLIAVLLVLSMLPVSNMIGVVSVAAFSDYTAVGENGVDGYEVPLYIYNNICYTAEDGSAVQTDGNGFLLTGTNRDLEIFVGNSENPDENAQSVNANIELGLKELHINRITVNEVADGEAFVNAISKGEVSSVSHIKVADNAKLNITAEKDLTISVLELGENSTVTVKAVDGAVLNIGSVSGFGVKTERRIVTSAAEEVVIESEESDLAEETEEIEESTAEEQAEEEQVVMSLTDKSPKMGFLFGMVVYAEEDSSAAASTMAGESTTSAAGTTTGGDTAPVSSPAIVAIAKETSAAVSASGSEGAATGSESAESSAAASTAVADTPVDSTSNESKAESVVDIGKDVAKNVESTEAADSVTDSGVGEAESKSEEAETATESDVNENTAEAEESTEENTAENTEADTEESTEADTEEQPSAPAEDSNITAEKPADSVNEEPSEEKAGEENSVPEEKQEEQEEEKAEEKSEEKQEEPEAEETNGEQEEKTKEEVQEEVQEEEAEETEDTEYETIIVSDFDKPVTKGSFYIKEGSGEIRLGMLNVCTFSAEGGSIKLSGDAYAEKSLALSYTDLQGDNSVFTFSCDAEISDGEINGFEFFGYDKNETGNKTITISKGARLVNVENFGADEKTEAIVRINGLSKLGKAENSVLVSDFNIDYYDGAVKLDDIEPSMYRAAYVDKKGTLDHICGTISDGIFTPSTALPVLGDEAGENVENSENSGIMLMALSLADEVEASEDEEFEGWYVNGDNSASYFDLLAEEEPIVSQVGTMVLNTEAETSLINSHDEYIEVGTELTNSKSYTNVALTDYASLSVDTGGSGEFTVTGTTNISGNLIISGSGKVNFYGDVTVGGYIDFSGTVTVNFYNGAALTIGGALVENAGGFIEKRAYSSINGAIITGASFLGFGSADTATLEIGGNASFTDVECIGVAADGKTQLTLTGDGEYTLNGTSALYYDVAIGFYDMWGNELDKLDNSFTAYRVKQDVNGKTFNGEATLILPNYSKSGYDFLGWATAKNQETGISELSVAHIGTTALYAVVLGKAVTVSYSLGFTADSYTTDTDTMESKYNTGSESANIGKVLTLEKLYRFGYEQTGWNITDGDEVLGTIEFPVGQSTADYAIAEDGLVGDNLYLTAAWQAKTYPVKYKLIMPEDESGKIYDIKYLRVKCDATNGEWLTYEELSACEGITAVFSEGDTFQADNVPYGSTFEEFLSLCGMSGFEAIVVNDDGNTLYTLHSSETYTYITVNDSKKLIFGEENGETGYFGKTLPENTSIREYEALLSGIDVMVFKPLVWKEKNYNLSFADINTAWTSLWKIYVNDEDKTNEIKNSDGYMLADVPYGTKVTFKVPSASTSVNANFGLWTISTANGAVAAYEETYTEGDEYYCYSFAMPETDTTASFTAAGEVTLNLKRSPVTEETITLNGRTRDGFWTSERLVGFNPLLDKQDTDGYGNGIAGAGEVSAADGYCNGEVLDEELRYFYEYSKTAALYITTGDSHTNVPTSADEVANGINTEEEIIGKNGTQNQLILYAGAKEKRTIYITDCHLWATSDYSTRKAVTTANANIFEDRKTNNNGEVYFYHNGANNFIGSIYSKCSNNRIYGLQPYTDVRIGSIKTASYVYFSNASLLPYECELFPDKSTKFYDGACMSGITASKNSRIMMPNKSFYKLENMHNFDYVHAKTITNNLRGSNILFIAEGNVDASYEAITLTGQSSAIIKGKVTSAVKTNTNQTVCENGIFLVLGNVLETSRVKVANGILIANSIGTNQLNVSGGKVIANNIRNHRINPTASNQYNYLINSNGDSDFIKTGKYETRTSELSSGDIYLMSEYAETNRGTSETVKNTALNKLLEGVDLENTKDLTYEQAQALVEQIKTSVNKNLDSVYNESKENNAENESLIFGDSAGTSKSLALTGANVYSAGRLTFFDSIDITGGTIEAPVISCKQDMVISGGTINAKEIGNSASILSGSTGQLRYAKTDITGGVINGVERLGAVTPSSAYTSSVDNHSYVTIGEDAKINNGDDRDISVNRDIYINYPGNSITESAYNALSTANKANYAFTIADDMPVCIPIEFIGKGDELEKIEWTSGSDSFDKPVYIADTSVPYKWSLSESEAVLTNGYSNAALTGGDLAADEKALADKDCIRLYAYTVTPRSINIYQDSSIIESITIEGEAQDISADSNTLENINPGDSLVITLNKDMTDKTVFWHKDDSGVYNNIYDKLTVSDGGKTISFSMPNLDNVELFICDEMTLYTDEHHIEMHSDGFDMEIDDIKSSEYFVYDGKILITSNIGSKKSSNHNVSFAEGFKNYDIIKEDENGNTVDENGYPIYKIVYDESKKVTLKDAFVSYNSKGIFLKKGVYAAIGIDGTADIKSLSIDNAHIDLYGVQGDRTDTLAFTGSPLIADTPYIEDVSFTNLKIAGGGCALIAANEKGKTIVFNSCDIIGSSWFNGAGSNHMNYTFIDCNITWSGGFLHKTADITMRNTVYRYKGAPGFHVPLGYGDKGNIILDNSKMYGYEGTGNSTAGLTYQANGNQTANISSLTLKNNSEFICSSNYRIDGPTVVEGNSKLWIGVDKTGSNPQGRFRSSSITVSDEGSEIQAGYVVASGYINNGNVYITSGTMTVSNGGKITATELIGGDGSTINLNNGELSAKYIGTPGNKYVKNGTISAPDDVYIEYAQAKNKSTLNLNSGTVNIADGGYIGGGTSVISLADTSFNGSGYDISGASVDIDNVSGIEADEITASSGNITVSGENTTITANTITANNGTVTLTGGNRVFENPLNTATTTHDNVAYVTQALSANNILVTDDAYAYAKNAATVSVNGNSSFVVKEDGRLYTESYSSPSDDGADRDYFPSDDDDTEQNIWGRVSYSVVYVLGLENEEQAPVNNNPDSYFNEQDPLYLNDPTHPAYDFLYWTSGEDIYTSADDITKIVPASGVLKLTAVWKPCRVKFKVRVRLTGEDLAQAEGVSGITEIEDGLFEWVEPVYVKAGEYITGTNGIININNYPLSTKKAVTMQLYNEDDTYTTLGTTPLSYSHIALYREKVKSDADASLYIYLTNLSQTRMNITFDLNMASTMSSVPNTSGVEFINSKYTTGVDFGVTLNSYEAIAALTAEDGVSAAGYTFLGWSRKNINDYSEIDTLTADDFINPNTLIDQSTAECWYAIWKPNEYYIVFDAVPHSADDGVYYIKQGADEPDEDADSCVINESEKNGVSTENIIMTYDHSISTGTDENGTILSLPTAWRENYHFTNWYYISDGVKYPVENTDSILKIDGILSHIDFVNNVYDKDSQNIAITFYADYEHTQIRYNPNGGSFTTGIEDVQEPSDVGEMLMGYYEDTENGGYGIEDDSDEGDSWKTGAFSEHSYRNVIINPGYTFTGWVDKNGTIIYTSPKFSHAEVEAQWRANTYTLNLHPYKEGGSYNENVAFTALPKTNPVTEPTVAVVANVTVGEPLNNSTASAWPSRDKWGTYYSPDTSIDPRPLWGFSLFPFDPVYPAASELYDRYNKIARDMSDSKQLMIKSETSSGGMKFALQNMAVMKDILNESEQAAYGDYLKIIDAPDGAVLDMYAIYKEYALIFAERYFENNTEMLESLKTVSYGSITSSDLAEPNPIHGGTESGGLGWFLNSKTYNPNLSYDKDEFLKNIEAYKENAKTSGEYDIYAYYLYPGYGVVDNVTLMADTTAQNDTSLIDASRIEHLTVPASILDGVVRFVPEADAELPTFVTKEVLEKNLYKTQIDSADNTPDNTVALVIKKGDTEYSMVKDGNDYRFKAADGRYLYAKGDDELQFILYHSHIMTEQKNYNFKMIWNFDYQYENGDFKEIPGQYFNINNFEILLNPSIYTLKLESGIFTDDNSTEKTGTLKEIFAYPKTANGSVGDYLSGWRMGNISISGSNYTEIIQQNGVITLSPTFSVVSSRFTVSDDVTALWDVTVGGASYSGSTSLPYGTNITFRKKSNVTTYPEFILKNDERSFRSKSYDDSFSFNMPASDVSITFSDIEELTLNKDILIEESEYTYGASSYLWRGGYLIESNGDTENVLTVDGDLSDRSIKLGKLSITASDSIVIADGTNAVLTATEDISLKSILVGNDANLSVTGNTLITLSPAADKSAIGNNTDGKGSVISVSGCEILVKPVSAKPVKWFGGANAAEVNFTNTVLGVEATANLTSGSYIAYADKVNITNSVFGEDVDYNNERKKSLTYPVYAESILNIANSTIYMNYIVGLSNLSPLGTSANGETNISDSKIFVSESQSQGSLGTSYRHVTGNMHIKGNSSVNIFEYEIIDVENTASIDGKNGRNNFMLVGTGSSSTLAITNSPNVIVLADTDASDYKVALSNITFNGTTKLAGLVNNVSLVLSGDLSGIGDLTLNDITISAEKVGSTGGTDNVSTVELKNVNITADEIGAIGTHEVFTFVTLSGSNTFGDSTIIQDWYRVQYELDRNIELDIPENFIFRTNKVGDSYSLAEGCYEVPPTLADKNENSSIVGKFGSWYFLNTNGERCLFSTDGTVLSINLLETAAFSDNDDGTKTLSIYAELKATGTAYIQSGKLFEAFEETSSSVAITENGAWTALLNGENSHMPGCFYQLTFDRPLPFGTRITLIMLSEPNTYYGYVVNAENGEAVIHWSNFVKMGTSVHWQTPDSLEAVTDKMLVVMNYADVSESTQIGYNSADFECIVGNSVSRLDTFNYTITDADAGVSAEADSISVTAPINSVYAGKDLCLIAEVLCVNGTLPFTATASLDGKNAKLLDSNKFVFDISAENGEYKYSFGGIESDYEVIWHLALKNDGVNVLSHIIASSDAVSFSGITDKPYLSASLKGTRTLSAGKAHTGIITYETNQENVFVTAEKQSSVLADFKETDAFTVTATDDNTITVKFPETVSSGVYRVCISINESSKNDNIYFTFTVK